MDILENLFFSNIEIYTNKYKKRCTEQVAGFQVNNNDTKWKYMFNLGAGTPAYFTIYASKATCSKEHVIQIAKHLFNEVMANGCYAEGLTKFAKAFPRYKITNSQEARLRNVQIDTTKEELEMIANIRSLI